MHRLAAHIHSCWLLGSMSGCIMRKWVSLLWGWVGEVHCRRLWHWLIRGGKQKWSCWAHIGGLLCTIICRLYIVYPHYLKDAYVCCSLLGDKLAWWLLPSPLPAKITVFFPLPAWIIVSYPSSAWVTTCPVFRFPVLLWALLFVCLYHCVSCCLPIWISAHLPGSLYILHSACLDRSVPCCLSGSIFFVFCPLPACITVCTALSLYFFAPEFLYIMTCACIAIFK